MNIRRIVEIAWIAVAAVSSYEFYVSYTKNGWNQRTIILLIAVAVAFFMYSFRRRSRLRQEAYNDSNKDVK